jgi:hypothetical protein
MDIGAVFNEVRDLQNSAPDGIFIVPPYFAYIAKCFTVLEGIGLSGNPQYSILNECLPYISQRLLSSNEDSEALEAFVFGDAKDEPLRIVAPARVEQLLEGAQRFRASVGGGDVQAEAKALVDLALTTGPLQSIVLEQVALIASAVTRQRWKQLRQGSGYRLDGRSRLGALADPLGLFRSSALVKVDDTDERTLEAAAKLTEHFQTGASAEELRQAVTAEAWQRRREFAPVTRQFTAKLLAQAAQRIESNAKSQVKA